MSSGDSSAGNEYADKLIEYLQSRNKTLSFIWPSLVVVIAALLALSMWLYWNLETAKANWAETQRELETRSNISQSVQEKLSIMQEQLSASERLNQQLNDKNNELLAQSMADQDSLGALKEQLSNLGEGAQIARQETSKIKQALTELEKEKRLQSSKNAQQSGTIKQQKTTIERLESELDSRKSAYAALANRQQESIQEMERLSTQLDTQASNRETIQKDLDRTLVRVDQLKTQNQRLQEERLSLEQDKAALERRLEALISPISQAPKQTSNPVANIDRADGILTAPIQDKRADVVKQAPSADRLDYGQIAVD